MKDSTTAVISLVLLCILLILAPVGVRIYQTWQEWMTAALVLATSTAIIAGAVGTACLIGLQTWRFAIRGQRGQAGPVVIDGHADAIDAEFQHWRMEDTKARALTRQHELETSRTPFLPAPGWAGQYQDIAAGGTDPPAT